ncbi:L-threonate dehydrogenase [Yoonia sediminilitoris]|uniref:L-threonate dehydrogenase n=1 Tax=Yoonia sediminilitoris TaxID=1286148 RepID=A0A2T6KQY4_9RHOB|nr:L-threonate dehydrogenase [Yoonia sediminilitoris]PUB18945.1 3-hydroxyisobutyrate dehydrogenase [Yoonia sediminilitoris]RCW99113.1 3-hydroxyisobutyrate dehydrogenase [Yoonia sediminilitoris]
MASGAVAIFGLGAMGAGMAGALLRAGLTTHGYDINADAVARFQAAGGATGSVEEVAETLDAVVVVVVNAAQTEAVLFGDNGIAAKLSAGTVVVACATVAPDVARDLAARCADLGLLYLDAPVSGGTIRAADGTLSILASGSRAAFAKAQPALDAMASQLFDLGDEVGAGSSMKAVNQMLVGIQIAAMGEALTFGMTQGVAPDKFLEIISQCAGTSWALESRAPHVIAGDYTPLSAVDIWLKDLGIVLDIAKGAKFGAPLTAAALQQYLAASGSGLGKEDDAAVAKVYARNAGLTLPGGE